MSISQCAELVQKGDPDRFLAAMAAPLSARERLFPLYALNVEVARAPWVTAEPLIAEMRLQWWKDVLEEITSEAEPRAHEVVAPLSSVIHETGISTDLLREMIEARLWDINDKQFLDEASLLKYLDQTGGHLMWVAAQALGAPQSAEEPIRAVARAGALASWLRAVHALQASGRMPLPKTSENAISKLAAKGLGWLSTARAMRRLVPRVVEPALYPAWQADALLKKAVKEPSKVLSGELALPEVSRRGRLLWRATFGRW